MDYSQKLIQNNQIIVNLNNLMEDVKVFQPDEIIKTIKFIIERIERMNEILEDEQAEEGSKALSETMKARQDIDDKREEDEQEAEEAQANDDEIENDRQKEILGGIEN